LKRAGALLLVQREAGDGSRSGARPDWLVTVTSSSRSLICVTGLRGLPGVMGGVESHCEELLPRIAALDPSVDIEVLARRPYLPGPPRTFRGVRVTPRAAPKGRTTEAIISTASAVLYARRKRARAVHIHAVGPALVAPLARALGMKVIFTHHGADYNRAKWGKFAKHMLRTGERLGIRSAHAVIAVSPSLASELKEKFPQYADKIRHIPNGAPTLPDDGDADSILSKLGLGRGEYILAVGRLVPEKGFHDLIEAHRKSRADKKLLIVGGADHESMYSKGLRSHAGPDVIFAGVQTRAVLKHLYENADRFVLPSFHEGLPIAAMEAGISGCPIVLSGIAPNRDIGLPARNYFAPGNVDELAQALACSSSDLRVDPDFFRRTYDWDEIAARTLEVYRAVLES
jgi:glycosyltransferase involved in cell wall biosynthesis